MYHRLDLLHSIQRPWSFRLLMALCLAGPLASLAGADSGVSGGLWNLYFPDPGDAGNVPDLEQHRRRDGVAAGQIDFDLRAVVQACHQPDVPLSSPALAGEDFAERPQRSGGIDDHSHSRRRPRRQPVQRLHGLRRKPDRLPLEERNGLEKNRFANFQKLSGDA